MFSSHYHNSSGWHVECSALAHFVFGDSVDFHFGGKDLVFPHHYNESACCYAFQDVRSGPVHGWSKYWLHSGHLIFKHEVGDLLDVRCQIVR